MIPLKLQLKNFLSYGPEIQTVDLSTYPLICLSGKNGHGKSALLDAMTWALWGQARKVTGNAKADQGLLRLGQTQMMVSLDFEFNHQIYRVRREFSVTYGKPLAALDFGIVNTDESFVPLTDKTISLTQDVIEHTLNLSFDSFSNSAFLRQGQANEFSKKSPKDRKEILATILGLNQYETVRTLAMNKIRQATIDRTARLTVQEKIELELQKKDLIVEQLGQLDIQLLTHNTQETMLKQQAQTLADGNKQLFEDQKKYQVITFALNQLIKKEDEDIQQLRSSITEWKIVHKKQLLMTDPKALDAEKQELLNQIKQYQYALQKTLELKEQYLKHKETAQQLSYQLKEKQNAALQHKKIAIERLLIEKQTDEKSIIDTDKQLIETHQDLKKHQSSLTALHTLLTSQPAALQKLQSIEKQFDRRKEHYQKFLEQGKWVTSELENLEQKTALAHDDEDPSCPLCEQNLSAARKRFLKQKFVEQEQFLKRRLQRITLVVKQLKAVLIEQHKELEAARKQIEQLALAQAQYHEHEKNIEKIKVSSDQLATHKLALEKKLLALSLTIAADQLALDILIKQDALVVENNNEYQAIIKQLKDIEVEAKKLQYNQELHKKVDARLAIIEQQSTEYMKLMQELALQNQRQKVVSQLCSDLKVVRKEKTELTLQAAMFGTLQDRQKAYEQQELQLVTTTKELAQHKEQILDQKARLETQRTALENLEKEHKEQQVTITALQETIYDYQAIAAATGKDGIQALLIEDAIPEIEQEANSLLARLTNNQAQVFFESLRDLKKGGSKETLDIKISDSQGIRPYEMFSGGEAFRIDFAIRIAISKLLARRAGTSLQTLIIDEGFGSQDEEGLALIMDALHNIQEDFSKIIIVSHLASMKDNFPVHFVVDKGPNGSTVSVIEQG
jgi:exonuclease SbcC